MKRVSNTNTRSPETTSTSGTSLPPWLEETKDMILTSPEWNVCLDDIYTSLKELMRKDHIQYSFFELGAEERQVLMRQIEDELKTEPMFKRFVATMTNVIDQNIWHVVDTEFHRDVNGAKTKLEILNEQASIGAAKLLERLPNEKQSVPRLLLNCSIPRPLRHQIWKSHLIDPQVKEEYEAKLGRGRIDTISMHDAIITQKCHALLAKSTPLLRDANGTQVQIILIMKTALSYFETVHPLIFQNTSEALYLLMIPLLRVFYDPDQDQDQSFVLFVELIFALRGLHRLRLEGETPSTTTTTTSEQNLTLPLLKTQFITILNEQVQRMDIELYRFMETLVSKKTTTPAHFEAIRNDDVSEEIACLCQAYVEHLFVGLAQSEVVLFIWDQCLLIGFPRLLPEFCAAFLVLLKNQIQQCEDYVALMNVIQTQSGTIQLRPLQHIMQTFVMDTIRKEMNLDTILDFHQPVESGALAPLVFPSSSHPSSVDAFQTTDGEKPEHEEHVEKDAESTEERLNKDMPSSHTPDLTTGSSSRSSPRDPVAIIEPKETDKIAPPRVPEEPEDSEAHVDYKVLIDGVQGFESSLNKVLYGMEADHASIAQTRAKKVMAALTEAHEKAQKSVYKRVYSKADLDNMSEKEREQYDKKYPKYEKAYEKLHAKYVKAFCKAEKIK